ncbi:probable ATP-dependent RNA helicase DDX43 [Vespa crabro]|uniref:probable ATP-dependent RNA helicase DDX43 n=1 Tax=Vespa crabro TaxID=7445 RepID=UPI001F007F41|nr:probable ATP-dependent RNA helicase DDX43 [Vespa crabro]
MAELQMNEGWNSDQEFEYPFDEQETEQVTRKKIYSTKTRFNNFRSSKNGSQQAKSNDLIINIDSKKVGKLIGKGGCNIKELQDKSKTRIQINQSTTCGISTVTLIGTPAAQNNAKELIDELLKDTPQPVKTEQKKGTKFNLNRINRSHEEPFTYPPIYKNFYQEDPVITQMSAERVAEIRVQNNNIEVQHVFDDEESNVDLFCIPNPIETFEQAFHNYPQVLEEIKKQGFTNPSPIQRQGWPILLSGKDMIGIAQTGTGKTLAFLLPALIHIDGQKTPFNERVGPNVLILAPTRELALQIEKEVGKYSYRNIKAVCLYGGGNRQDQIDIVTEGVQIVIATPGRLNDLVLARAIDLRSVTYLVLDEADRMLDMGFEPQIRKSLFDVRSDRQTIMTRYLIYIFVSYIYISIYKIYLYCFNFYNSATWPPGVRRLARSYMKDPIQVFVGSLNLSAVHTVKQHIHMIDEEDKLDVFYEFIRNMDPEDKIIVFFSKKARVDDISSELSLSYIKNESIHGGRDQEDREQAIEDFKNGSVRILLATDVVSRGIDIEDITHVFNYDFPRDIEEYVHRVGRTGRAGKTGESLTLMTKNDWSHSKELISILEEANQMVPEELYSMAERYEAWKTKRAEGRTNRSNGQGYKSGYSRQNKWGGKW